MLPLALEFWLKNEADVWLDRIENAPHKARCVFFEPDQQIPRNGRCRVYSLRPLICRLFGFFTVKDKHANYIYGSCKIIKEQYPQSYSAAKKMIAEGFHPSNMTDFAVRIISMGSELSRKMIPINTAAKTALEKIGFEIQKRQWQ